MDEKKYDVDLAGIADVPTIRVQISGLYSLIGERDRLSANLEQVQQRCTELLLENRELRALNEAAREQLNAGTQVVWHAEEYEPGCWRALIVGNDTIVGHGPTQASAIEDLRKRAWKAETE